MPIKRIGQFLVHYVQERLEESERRFIQELARDPLSIRKYVSENDKIATFGRLSSSFGPIQGAPCVFERFSEAVLRSWVDVEIKCYHIFLTQVYTFQIP